MQTSGHGNDSLMILVPVGVALVVGVILFGGPANAIEAVDGLVREIVHQTMTVVSAWF
jgi:hypothetical protein